MAMGHRALVTGTNSFALSLVQGNTTCSTVSTHHTVAFCAGTIRVNGEDLVGALFGRRELAEGLTAHLEAAKEGHAAAIAELRDDAKQREAVIEALLAHVTDDELVVLRAERNRLLQLLQ